MPAYQQPPTQTKYPNDTTIKQTSFQSDQGVKKESKPAGFTYTGGGDGPQTGSRTLGDK